MGVGNLPNKGSETPRVGGFLDAFWSPFRSLLAAFWLPSVPFGLPLAPFGGPLGSLWLSFGVLWLTFAQLGAPFSHFPFTCHG